MATESPAACGALGMMDGSDFTMLMPSAGVAVVVSLAYH